jgi:hypothetical protein
MDEQLQRLVRHLREESCPPEVMERVARRIAQEKASARRFWPRWGWAVACVVLLVTLGAWQWQSALDAQRRVAELEAREHADRARADRVRVAEQTAGALAYIGQALREAAAHSQDSILKKAVPPLRDGLQTTKNKVMDRI